VPTLKLFVSGKKLLEQRSQQYKHVLGSSLGEDDFSNSGTKQDRTRQRTLVFVSAGILQELGSQTPNYPKFESW
jgi:hypothetical protein